MTSPHARPVPWRAVVQFHREVMRRAGGALFALPVTAAAAEHWSSLAGFEPGQLAGPWQADFQVLESPHLQRAVRAGLDGAFIGGPCWFRWVCDDEQHQRLEWIPLIYREVTVENRDDRLRITPVDDGWNLCPLVFQFLAQHQVQTVAPLDELLPDLLIRAESKAAEDGHPLTRTLADAFRLVAPELGTALLKAHADFPTDRVEHVPSPWVLFSASAGCSATTQHSLRDYARLERTLAAAPQEIGGLALLQRAPAAAVQAAPDVAPIVPLTGAQRSAVAAALARRPVTVINAPPGCGESEVILSILLNGWARSTSVLLASNNEQAVDAVRQRLKSLESDFEIAVQAGEQSRNNIDQALGRTIDLITARRGESHYGGSLSGRKREQLMKKKQRLREFIDGRVPQRLSEAIEAALASHAARREALAALESRREELLASLRDLDVEADPGTFSGRVLEPIRKWRNGIEATRRLIKEDAQRSESLQNELSTARADRDGALTDCQIEARSDEDFAWLLAEPGFRSLQKALAALAEKLAQPIEDESADGTWDKAYDEWSSSEAAADWERKARETAALIRPAGIAIKEKTEEVRAAREALDSAQRTVQEATKTASLDVRREDVDEWAECYAEFCALPRAKLKFLPQSKNAELLRRLEKAEGKLRISLPVHLWTGIGQLNETGRIRLSRVIEPIREWCKAREDWDNLSTVREEIESDTEALRRKLVALGKNALATEVTPTACAAIAAKLNEEISVAAAAAAAWSKREAKERLPSELAELAAQIRAAGAGTPIKERWLNGAGAPLMAALDAVASNPGVATIMAVRTEVLGPVATDPVVKNWQRAYAGEEQRAAIAEELERIPPPAARLTHWNARRPSSMPADLDLAGAFDGDDTHPVWAYLQACEAWSTRWASFRDEEAPALEQTANSEGASAIRRIGEAANTLPPGKERTWLESIASRPAAGERWPVDKMKELAGLWSPERLQAEIDKVDAQLERIGFETAREQWLDRVAREAGILQTLGALRYHYGHHQQRIEEDGYAHFEQALKAQSVWITSAASAYTIPMRPGLFDVLVIDGAAQCTLTDLLPLIFRAKRLVVIGDAEQSASIESPAVESERTLAARFGVENWAGTLAHAGSNVYKAAADALPRRQADVISLVGADKEISKPDSLNQ